MLSKNLFGMGNSWYYAWMHLVANLLFFLIFLCFSPIQYISYVFAKSAECYIFAMPAGVHDDKILNKKALILSNCGPRLCRLL